MLSNISDRISFWSLFAVIVLLPVFFLPFTQIPMETSKGLLLVIGLVIKLVNTKLEKWITKVMLLFTLFQLSAFVLSSFAFTSELKD